MVSNRTGTEAENVTRWSRHNSTQTMGWAMPKSSHQHARYWLLHNGCYVLAHTFSNIIFVPWSIFLTVHVWSSILNSKKNNEIGKRKKWLIARNKQQISDIVNMTQTMVAVKDIVNWLTNNVNEGKKLTNVLSILACLDHKHSSAPGRHQFIRRFISETQTNINLICQSY